MQMLECFGFGLAFMDLNSYNAYKYKNTTRSCCYEVVFVNHRNFE